MTLAAFSTACLWLVLSWSGSLSRLPSSLLGLVLLLPLMLFALCRLFWPQLLIASSQYLPASHLLRFQLTPGGYLWITYFSLLQLTSLGWLAHMMLRSPSSIQRRQAGWMIGPLCLPLIQLLLHLLPSQLRDNTFLYFSPLLMACVPIILAWVLLSTDRLFQLPYYQSIAFQRMATAGLVLDNRQRILALNPVAEQLFQISLEQVEGQALASAFPLLDDPTEPLMIDGAAYSYDITQLSGSGSKGRHYGQMIRLSSRPSAASVQQLYDDLGLRPQELIAQLPTGERIEYQYLGDLVFLRQVYFDTTLQVMESSLALMDRIIEAGQVKDKSGFYLILDVSSQQHSQRSARRYLQQKMPAMMNAGLLAGLVLINSNWFARQMIELVRRLQPQLRISTHTNLAPALAWVRQQQQQQQQDNRFLELWQENLETMQVGDQRLKVVHWPKWAYSSEAASLEYLVIEGETVITNLSGLIEPDVVERIFDGVGQIVAQLGGGIRYLTFDTTDVTAASYLTRIK
ncbi:MAG: hypothetical protein VYA08_09940, partial [Pseudomonadota bacterium]|nr:hypothetical protein [Pseudomonadota bacterium]